MSTCEFCNKALTCFLSCVKSMTESKHINAIIINNSGVNESHYVCKNCYKEYTLLKNMFKLLTKELSLSYSSSPESRRRR